MAAETDRIQRWASILLGLAVVVVIGWLTLEQASKPIARARPDDAGAMDAAAEAAAPAATASAAPASDDDASAPLKMALESDDGGSLTSLLAFGSDAGTLPSGAPRTVRIGVVLVQWQGAEGARASTRAKKDALVLAQKLAEDAKGDFGKTVNTGDPGSSSDIGRIPRGVLDPTTEVSVFGLAAGEVSGVLETPRGYWIVKRID